MPEKYQTINAIIAIAVIGLRYVIIKSLTWLEISVNGFVNVIIIKSNLQAFNKLEIVKQTHFISKVK